MCGGSVPDMVMNSTGIPQLQQAMNGDTRGLAATAVGGQGTPQRWGVGQSMGRDNNRVREPMFITSSEPQAKKAQSANTTLAAAMAKRTQRQPKEA